MFGYSASKTLVDITTYPLGWSASSMAITYPFLHPLEYAATGGPLLVTSTKCPRTCNFIDPPCMTLPGPLSLCPSKRGCGRCRENVAQRTTMLRRFQNSHVHTLKNSCS